MKSKIKLTLVILLNILLLISSCKNSTINDSETNFAVSDTSIIDSIIIKKQNDSIVITKHEDWLVNGIYIADYNAVVRALNTIRLVKLNSPLPDNAIKSVADNIKKETYIEIYNNDKLLLSYYIGKYIKGSGNYYMLSTSETPYIAFVPSFDIDLRTNFSTDLKKWQSTILFKLKPEHIKNLHVKDNKLQKEFYFENDNGEFKIYQNKNTTRLGDVDSDKILFYLMKYENVSFEKFIYNIDNQYLDSLQNEPVIFEIDVENTNNNKINFKAFNLISNGNPNIDLFLGLIDNKDVVIAKFYNFDLLIKDYTYFLK